MSDFILHRFIFIGILVTVLALAGCGVKGPPVTPKTPPVAKVAELVHSLDGATVILEWTLADSLSGKQTQKAAFAIYRFRAKLSEPVCDTCPLVFEKVAAVPYTDTVGNRFSNVVDLDAGYRYAFKVRLEIDGRSGADSNLVRFDFP